ncbi:MAG: PEP-CTERM sorting domain-containing protein [Chitinophagia bacterium]|nr:PEP-CTERM sorting domain-containing protein [Chitinophagia bacterium]
MALIFPVATSITIQVPCRASLETIMFIRAPWAMSCMLMSSVVTRSFPSSGSISEPSTGTMLIFGLLGLAGMRARQRKV